ncbi:Two-component system WalR/WalK regulatory protein YycH [Neobacillus rhizosphaerae]|uniref:Two-component system WalR/WalK regulatory protein YycH n=1 Tax=Neobacillus rhizosphaerae TaxID=2880965 RepID=A0ABN8KQI4_9BACI|nr:two-component system activity regulator YycH [Neobacillus rhizosphaerae]CAH2714665.1 Two-component system WalR/WalK regulatory protein YycH [Neobacillus rhizosphaerae]
MRYEKIKSGILTILVLGSILLTWNLWTYQPNYATMEKNNYVEEVTVREKQEVQKIIRPDQILFHVKGRHYGTNNTTELEKVIKDLSRWAFFDIKNYSDKVENIEELTHDSGNAEIIFPGEVPIELYRSVLTIEGKKVPSFNFDRIIINVDSSEKENGIVYFVSSENQQVFISHISSTNLSEFNHDFYKNATQLPSYFAYKASEKRTIFLPEEETEMTTYKYLPLTLNSEEFKVALFNDPSFVQKSIVKQGEEYTNGSSKMSVNYQSNILKYINPTAEDNYMDSSYDLVKRSIDFVNEHGGWTDSYRFVSKSEYNRSVTFRLYSMDGFPVFNRNGLSEINEEWGRDEINKYERPNISLELPLPTEMQKVKRPSGHVALEYLQKKKDFKPELLEQMTLGFRMERDSDANRLILLEPAWFYRYDKTWVQITMEDLGGLQHGLE